MKNKNNLFLFATILYFIILVMVFGYIDNSYAKVYLSLFLLFMIGIYSVSTAMYSLHSILTNHVANLDLRIYSILCVLGIEKERNIEKSDYYRNIKHFCEILEDETEETEEL